MVPKAELHVHLEGTATPELVRRLAERNGLPVPEGLFADEETYAYTDFLDFLRAYDLAAGVIRSGDDYRDRDLRVPRALRGRGRGVRRADRLAGPRRPGRAERRGAPRRRRLAASMTRGQSTASRRACSSTAIRNYGVERAERVARYAASRPHPYVAGFQLAGDEAGYPADDFAEPYRIAADAGLGCSVHAGEWGGPESVRAALTLPVTRIGHGVRSIEDPALVDELAERGVVLECCPTSNVVLGIYPSYEEHPLRALRAAGIRVTLGSDDPPWFGASIGSEYAVCSERLGFGDDDLRELTGTALEAAFCEEKLKENLISAHR